MLFTSCTIWIIHKSAAYLHLLTTFLTFRKLHYILLHKLLNDFLVLLFFKLSVPTNPTNLKINAKRVGELIVSWDPPKEPKGEVDHYFVYWQSEVLNVADYSIRDYCENRKNFYCLIHNFIPNIAFIFILHLCLGDYGINILLVIL